jgi:hypothetical protein
LRGGRLDEISELMVYIGMLVIESIYHHKIRPASAAKTAPC